MGSMRRPAGTQRKLEDRRRPPLRDKRSLQREGHMECSDRILEKDNIAHFLGPLGNTIRTTPGLGGDTLQRDLVRKAVLTRVLVSVCHHTRCKLYLRPVVLPHKSPEETPVHAHRLCHSRRLRGPQSRLVGNGDGKDSDSISTRDNQLRTT